MSELFPLLNAINSCSVNYYRNLRADEKKQISLFLVNRWLSGTKNKQQILDLNNNVNQLVFSMYNDQDLLYKLMCTVGKYNTRYSWLSRTKKKSENLTLQLISQYYGCSTEEASTYKDLLDVNDMIEIGLSLNVDKDVLTKLKKEL